MSAAVRSTAARMAAVARTSLRAWAEAEAPALSIADLSLTSGQLHSALGRLTITMPVECSRSIRESLELPETRLPTMWGVGERAQRARRVGMFAKDRTLAGLHPCVHPASALVSRAPDSPPRTAAANPEWDKRRARDDRCR